VFEQRQVDELIRIAAAGGGFALNAAMKQTDDLIRIAAAASGKGSRITFHGLQLRPTDELIRIAAAGKGCVEFAE
jgi:DNA replication protein